MFAKQYGFGTCPLTAAETRCHMTRHCIRNIQKQSTTTFAREVTHMATESERVWYLPNHPVINASKPGKLIMQRSMLLQGPKQPVATYPNLNNSLVLLSDLVKKM